MEFCRNFKAIPEIPPDVGPDVGRYTPPAGFDFLLTEGDGKTEVGRPSRPSDRIELLPLPTRLGLFAVYFVVANITGGLSARYNL